VGEFTELALILHEIAKKTRHCRIRDLMTRAGTAVQTLKPCFLMSPLSLSRYIPSDQVKFDLVIMDEASQIKPEDAIGAILRAQQLVVVGDPKQLPPTSFFDRTDEELEDDEATQFDNAESVLEVAMKSFQPYRRLRWHYRSQHESLIHFSNHRFYDSDLIVFPSAKGISRGFGVKHHFVENATCTKGANVREAEAVVNKIVEHARIAPSESLGVAAFNQRQAELIQDLLDKTCDQDRSVAEAVGALRELDDDLFVKNLESIQGDERDVMFISYTYGPDPTTGRVFQRFGPINSEMGWRRLNVMVTRARKRMEIFASLQPGDIHTGPDKSRGVNSYKEFLEYAVTGRMIEAGSESGREPGSPFEESVAQVVSGFGLEPVFQIGVAGYFIDIGVRRPGEKGDFILGIECDGATYHSSRSARDRDRLREEVIRQRGWTLHRIWSTEWFLNQRQEEIRLQRVLEAILDQNK
jgi:superfamily I DNA and/or RNA helicase